VRRLLVPMGHHRDEQPGQTALRLHRQNETGSHYRKDDTPLPDALHVPADVLHLVSGGPRLCGGRRLVCPLPVPDRGRGAGGLPVLMRSKEHCL